MTTQLELARDGQISEAMKCVAQQEGVDVHVIRDELAAGRLVIEQRSSGVLKVSV